MSLTDEWLECFEQDKAAGTLNKSVFWRLAKIAGPPDGVDATDPRVIVAIKEIERAAIGVGGDDDTH